MMQTLEITDETFESEVLQAGEPTLVDFWAEWCAPCKMIAPAVEALAEEYEGKMRVAKMDVDSSRQTPQSYGIRGIPTLILFKDGAEAVRIVGGNHSKEALATKISPHLE